MVRAGLMVVEMAGAVWTEIARCHRAGCHHRGKLDGGPRQWRGDDGRDLRSLVAGRAGGGPHQPTLHRPGNERVRGRAQRLARAMHELTYGSLGEAHPAGDRGAALPLQRGGDHRFPLAMGQRRHCGEDLASGQATLDVVLNHDGADLAVGLERHLHRAGNPACGVAEDLVQPTAQVPNLRPGAKGDQGVEEGLLHGILGPSVGAQPAGHAQQCPVVAGDDRRKRLLITLAREAGQALITQGIGVTSRRLAAHAGSDPDGRHSFPGKESAHPGS
jgi:hypothetical protein